MLNRKSKLILCCLLTLVSLVFFTFSGAAEKNVKIGLVYPMTGQMATVGRHAVDAIQLAVDIINNEYPDIDLDLAPTAGLPNLGGAKIELVIANSQGQPEFGRAEVERLIAIDNISCILGCYQSSVTKAASQAAERYKTPFVTGISVATDLTERGFKYFFRVTPTEEYFVNSFFDFFDDLNKKKGCNIKNIGILYENDEFGFSSYNGGLKAAKEHGYNIVSEVKFSNGSIDLDSEVSILKKDQPDFILFSVQIADSILFVKTAKKLNYNPPGVASCGGGVSEPEFIQNLGEDANYYITRDVASTDIVEKIPLLGIINKMYRERTGLDFDQNIRAFVAMQVLADAINRAGSTNKEAIRQALIETNIPPDQLIVAWKGVKFDEKGQNPLGQAIVRQVLDGQLKTVWPFEIAPADVVYPIPKWDER